MTHLIDHRPVDPAFIEEVVDFVKTQDAPPTGLRVIAEFEPKGHERISVQRAMQVALERGLLHLTLKMTLEVGSGGRPGFA